MGTWFYGLYLNKLYPTYRGPQTFNSIQIKVWGPIGTTI